MSLQKVFQHTTFVSNIDNETVMQAENWGNKTHWKAKWTQLEVEKRAKSPIVIQANKDVENLQKDDFCGQYLYIRIVHRVWIELAYNR